jgi:hypothetical protein
MVALCTDSSDYVLLAHVRARRQGARRAQRPAPQPRPGAGVGLHSWIGASAPQDVRGVAAYKTVELDDLLEDGPVQRRELQVRLFPSYFGKSGFGTGFRHVGPDKGEPRLRSFHEAHHKSTRAFQVPLKARSLDHGNVHGVPACGRGQQGHGHWQQHPGPLQRSSSSSAPAVAAAALLLLLAAAGSCWPLLLGAAAPAAASSC